MKIVTGLTRELLRVLGYGLLGSVVVVLIVYVHLLESRPDL